MAGIVFGILNGMFTKGWLLIALLPLGFGLLSGGWKAFTGLNAEERLAREQMVQEGKSVFSNAQVPLLEAAWQTLLAYIATGIVLVIRFLLL